MPLDVFVRFEPVPGKEQQLHEELMLILDPTRAELGCVRIHLYKSARGPCIFFIHSEWVDQAAFDAHAQYPHMKRFLGLVGELTTHAVQAVRTQQIG